MASFDENEYVRVAHFDARPLGDLRARAEVVRRSHLYLFRGLDEASWRRRGVANGFEISVRAGVRDGGARPPPPDHPPAEADRALITKPGVARPGVRDGPPRVRKRSRFRAIPLQIW